MFVDKISRGLEYQFLSFECYRRQWRRYHSKKKKKNLMIPTSNFLLDNTWKKKKKKKHTHTSMTSLVGYLWQVEAEEWRVEMGNAFYPIRQILRIERKVTDLSYRWFLMNHFKRLGFCFISSTYSHGGERGHEKNRF